ncbi:MAG: hypothetical protein ACK4L7_09695 [Flavobacteriales bacterium]
MDERVTNGEIENNPYTPESRWTPKSELYAKLHDHPELLVGAADLQDFFDALAGSTIAALKDVADEQLGLYDLDNTVAEQLQANRVQAEAILELMHDALQQLADPALTTAQRTALLSTIAGYRQSLATLTAYQTAALTLTGTTKALTSEAVKLANAAIGTSALIEANEKLVTDIHLATIGKDVDSFSPGQAASLYDIATQCPLAGGNAVFKARALYQLIAGNTEFDDVALCLQEGLVVKQRTEPNMMLATIMPNPATERATLLVEPPLKAGGMLVLYNAQGAVALQRNLSNDATRLDFSIAELAPALYHFVVRTVHGDVAQGKLAIAR